MNTYSNLQERLFNAYRQNLLACGSNVQDVVLCPLCLTPYELDALKTNVLTDEHIIARNLGSRVRHQKWQELRTLTCKRCNNEDGSALDSHLIKMVRNQDIAAGLSTEPLDCRFEIGGNEIGADLFLSAEGNPRIKIIGDKRRSNPKAQKATGQAFEQGHKDFRVTINVGYKPLRSNIAILRIAYLLMFRHFGYNYILSKNVQKVREQIRNPEEDTLVSKAILKLGEAPNGLYSIGLVYEPQELRCFFVKLDLSTSLDRYIGVVLPGLDEIEGDIYTRWQEYRENSERVTCSCKEFAFNPEMPFDPLGAEIIESVWRGDYA